MRTRPILWQSLVPALALTAVVSTVRGDDNWPQFRGPLALGVAENQNLPDTWTATDNVLWKQEIPGRGWSSPIVWQGRVFLTTVINQGETEVQKPGLYLGGERRKPPADVHQWKVYCLDLASGAVLWERTAHQGPPAESIHLKNTYASETPVTDGKRLYAYFGNLGVFCYDLDGNPLWAHKVPARRTASGWGTGGSPTLHKERLYLLNDNEEESYLLALDGRTGEELWRTPREEKSSWTTPYVWDNGLRTEIVVAGSGVVRSYDLSGHPLWQLGDMSRNAIPTPFSGHGLLYVSSGHVMGNKKPIVAIRPGGAGDLTLTADQDSSPNVAWCQRQAAPYNPSILLYKDYIYVCRDLGIFSCYRATTGEMVYDKKRLPNGKAFTSSPWAYNDRVFCLSEYGETFVIQAGSEFKVLHTNPLAEDDMCLATPAIVGDKLLIRSDKRLYCLQKGAKLAAAP